MNLTHHETFTLESGAPGAGVLQPGTIQRALAAGAGVLAEEIVGLRPVARGRVEVDVSLPRALRLSTPRSLPLLDDGGRPTLLVLRRDDDLRSWGEVEVIFRWSSGEAPAPGALATALAVGCGGALGAEALGVAFAGPGWLRAQVPATVVASLELPMTLTLPDGRQVALESADGGKKKP